MTDPLNAQLAQVLIAIGELMNEPRRTTLYHEAARIFKQAAESMRRQAEIMEPETREENENE